MSAATANRGAAQHRSRPLAWWNSWAVALRIGRRDALRHRGRSLLVLAMIGLPVLVLVTALTGYATVDVSDAERVPGRMGSAQALVTLGDVGCTVHQDVLGEGATDCTPTGRPASPPLPGAPRGATLARLAPAVRAAFHADDVVPLADEHRRALLGSRRPSVHVLRVDPTARAVRGMVDLGSGRWPTAPDEVVVTDLGARLGLPTSGTVTLTPDALGTPDAAGTGGGPLQRADDAPAGRYRVVGTARAGAGSTVALVRTDTAPADATALLVDRAAPVPWSEVKEANRHGLVVASRDVIENPPPVGERYPEVDHPLTDRAVPDAVMALLMTALFVACALLAGPAFTVVAARQRRTLAMAASNGATGAQLRRTMLGQALVLGLGGAIVAAALGVALVPPTVALLRAWQPTVLGRSLGLVGATGPLDVPWPQVLLVVGTAALAAIVAAVLPARGLGDLDVVAALRGDVAPKRPRRRAPVVGVALAVTGGVLVWAALEVVDTQSTEAWSTTLLVVGCLALVGGALMSVPMLLVGVARALRSAPLAWRMAARDTARRRGPATSTVAAVMAGTTLLAGSLVMLASFDAMMRAEYRTAAPLGVSSVHLAAPEDAAAVVAAFRAEVPTARTTVVGAPLTRPSSADDGSPRRLWAIGPAGCRPRPADPDAGPFDSCTRAVVGDDGYSPYGTVLVVDPVALTGVVPLPATARTALESGGLVTTVPSLPSGRADVRPVVLREDPSGASPVVASPDGAPTVLPVVQVRTGELGTWNGATYAAPDQGVTLMTAATARRLGASVVEPRTVLARAPQPLTPEQERGVTARITSDSLTVPVDAFDQAGSDPGGYANGVTTERGYGDPLRGIELGLVAAVALLILVATVTATALAVGEARRDLVTLGTLGASPRTPRALAAATAALLAVVGTLVGYVVGAVPGVIWTHDATQRPADPTVEGAARTWDLVVPWGTLGATLVGTTLVAAAAAWLLVRPSVDLTRRTR